MVSLACLCEMPGAGDADGYDLPSTCVRGVSHYPLSFIRITLVVHTTAPLIIFTMADGAWAWPWRCKKNIKTQTKVGGNTMVLTRYTIRHHDYGRQVKRTNGTWRSGGRCGAAEGVSCCCNARSKSGNYVVCLCPKPGHVHRDLH